jgi:X-Pro dipeptidyl-peptidase
MDNRFDRTPVFENGIAQPVFPFTDGKSGEAYDPQTSAVARYCVYVESDYDTDGDGKNDLVKAFIQVPRSAAEGNYKAAIVFEARPYCAGVNEDGYDHMKEVESDEYPEMDIYVLTRKAINSADGNRGGACDCVSTMEAVMKADPADWYYPDKGSEGSYCYENLDNFNYYLVRGFAFVASAGFGTLGSDGVEFVGSHYERDAFKSVVEWLHGDRIAYTDCSRSAVTKADWSNGKVAMTGRSYAGTMPFAVAVTGVPGLETIIPVAGISDWYSFLNQQGAQRYWPKEMLMSFLS